LLVVVTTFAPIELRLLFSGEFESGATVLRWHFAGDVFKLCVWSLSYLLIARKDVSFFLISEIAFNALHVGLYFLLSPHIGFAAAGVSYFVAMLAASAFLLWICTKRHPLQISVSLVRLSVIWGCLLMSLLWLSVLLPTQIVFALGLLASGFTGAWSYFRLRKLVGPFRANL
jgi:PST family polysaccharide transporter